MFGMGFFEIVFVFVFSLPFWGLWIWALIDCLVNEPSGGGMTKVTWAIVILFGCCIGAPVYLFVRRPARIREHGK